MSVRVIAFVTIDEQQPQALARYLEATGPLLDSAGARIVQRFVLNEAVVGQRPAQSVIIVDYPDRAAVDRVFASQAYRDIIPFRDMAFRDYHVTVVAGEDQAEQQAAMENY
ncbi:DUF1330 domain-containing protein [Shimia sp.]|uniref:DUF1330 domain-containing protein n=1 Tax=Shimia sp. TaxID=1954381 RepID=UPI003568B452